MKNKELEKVKRKLSTLSFHPDWVIYSVKLVSEEEIHATFLNTAFVIPLTIIISKRDDGKACFKKTRSLNLMIKGRPGVAISQDRLMVADGFAAFLDKYDKGCLKDIIFKDEPDDKKETEIDFSRWNTSPKEISFMKEYAFFDGNRRHSVVMVLQSRCDWNCCFCFHGEMENTIKEEGLLEKLQKLSQTWKKDKQDVHISITGREPLNKDSVVDIINFCTENFGDILLQTTGHKLNDKMFLSEIKNVDRIKFLLPVYGPNDEIHDAVTGTAGSFNEVMKVIANPELKVKTHSVIIKMNMGHLKKIREMCGKYKREHTYVILYEGEKAKDLYAENVPKLTEVVKELKSFLGENDFVKFISENRLRIPMCISRPDLKAEKVSLRAINPDGKELNFPVEDAGYSNLVSCKNAEKCSMSKECPGVYGAYAKLYGWGEFVPLP